MTTITQVLTAPTTAPSRTQDKDTFNTNVDNRLAWQATNVSELTTWQSQANTVAGEVNTNAGLASAAASAADASETAAAASANFQGNWSSLTGALNTPASVKHNGVVWILLNNLADVTASEPGVTADWSSLGQFYFDSRTSNTILGVTDFGKIIKVTSGTFTQTFDTAANCGNGWFVYYLNAGTGDITLDPSASETIDGLTSFIMYPGEMRLIQCNGSVFTSIVTNGFRKSFTASGTFTKPPGYKTFAGFVVGAGNSGQRTNDVGTASKGGGGGGYWPFSFRASDLGSTETVTIGAGGAAVTTVADGNYGGTTSFGSHLVMRPSAVSFTLGGAIAIGSTAITGDPGIFTSTGTIVSPLSTAYAGSSASSDASQVSGSSVFGGAAGGSVDATATLKAAGTSVHSGDGGAAVSAGNGVAGTQPGGGGGATQTGASSGAGADGQVDIWGII